MERRIFGNIVLISVVAVVGMSFSVDECLADGQKCVQNNAQSPTHETCVEWSQGPEPDPEIDFHVDYLCTGCYEAPEIELLTGDDEWKVWTFVRSGGERAGPSDIGNLTTDPERQASFTVAIKGEAAQASGAINVGPITLTVDEDYSTSLAYSKITNNLTGNLTVQRSGASGGDVYFWIGGSVTGNIDAHTITSSVVVGSLTGNIVDAHTIGSLLVAGSLTGDVDAHTISSLSVGGSLTGDVDATIVSHLEVDEDYSGGTMDIETIDEDGDITIAGDLGGTGIIEIDEIDAGGLLEVEGAVAAGAAITVGDMSGGTAEDPVWVKFNTDDPDNDTFSGDLTLPDGIAGQANVSIEGETQNGADIDLTNTGVAGTLKLWRGGSANILNGGTVKGVDGGVAEVLLAYSWWYIPEANYSGNATFGRVADTLKTYEDDQYGSVTVDGTITVGYVDGEIEIDGDLDGDITISTGLYGGTLEVTGDVGSLSDISIADMDSLSGDDSLVDFQHTFSGDLDLHSGIKADQEVEISDFDGTIDLNNADVAGLLEFPWGGDGTISNGGAVSGTVTLASTSLNHFNGSATFASVSSTGTVQILGNSYLQGDIEITGSVAGTIAAGALLSILGEVSIGDDLTGEITAGGVAGNIDIDDDVSGDITIDGGVYGDIDIGDALDGDIAIDGDMAGDIDIDGAVSGAIDVQGTLKGTGRILIDGVCIGEITIGEETEQLSQIVIYGGLDDFAGPPAQVGSITINNKGEDFDANGTIHIGPSWTLPPLDVVFDGWILIQKEDGGAGGGDLGNRGRIEVFGCHATDDDLDICICGDVNGTIDIEQTGCTNQVTWSCWDEGVCN